MLAFCNGLHLMLSSSQTFNKWNVKYVPKGYRKALPGHTPLSSNPIIWIRPLWKVNQHILIITDGAVAVITNFDHQHD